MVAGNCGSHDRGEDDKDHLIPTIQIKLLVWITKWRKSINYSVRLDDCSVLLKWVDNLLINSNSISASGNWWLSCTGIVLVNQWR